MRDKHLLFLVLAFIVTTVVPSLSNAQKLTFYKLQGVSILFNRGNIPFTELTEEEVVQARYDKGKFINDEEKFTINRLKIDIKKIKEKKYFKALPKYWGIIIDKAWKKSEGYFHPSLRTPEGYPAILLQYNVCVGDNSRFVNLIHELAHMIFYNKQNKKQVWIEEGYALLTEYIITGYFSPVISLGFEHPETSLTKNVRPDSRKYLNVKETMAQYGHILQYFYYIYKLCGKGRFHALLLDIESKKDGFDFFNEVLKYLNEKYDVDPICKNFKRSFKHFQYARFFPKVYPKNTYIYVTKKRARIRDYPLEKLEPFSAQAYYLSNKYPECPEGADLIDESICFQIRYE